MPFRTMEAYLQECKRMHLYFHKKILTLDRKFAVQGGECIQLNDELEKIGGNKCEPIISI